MIKLNSGMCRSGFLGTNTIRHSSTTVVVGRVERGSGIAMKNVTANKIKIVPNMPNKYSRNVFITRHMKVRFLRVS
jgi:hypothetical protein